MKKVVSFGETLLRLSTPKYQRLVQSNQLNVSFGGGELNTVIALANYGIPVDYVTILPQSIIGDWCLSELKKHQVGTHHILRKEDRMGVYFLETGAVARGSKVLYDREASAITHIKLGQIDWYAVFEDAQWFHWTGILPAISLGAAEACLEAIEVANELGLTVSVDLNYRSTLWNYGMSARDILPQMLNGCDLILGVLLKDKEDELKVFQPSKESDNLIDLEAFEQASQEMMQRFSKAKRIVLTIRDSINANYNRWSGCMYSDRLYQSKEYNLTHIVDRVGGGDSFFAGLIYGFIKYPGDDQKALDFAIASSGIKHTIYGDFNLASLEEIKNVMNGDCLGRPII